MRVMKLVGLGLISMFLFGCAHINFNGKEGDNGLAYYESKPYLFVSTTKECVTTATVVMLPAEKKVMVFHPALIGSSALTAALSGNGTIASVGITSDTKLADVAAFATAVGGLVAKSKEAGACTPVAQLYPIIYDSTGLTIDKSKSIPFPIP